MKVEVPSQFSMVASAGPKCFKAAALVWIKTFNAKLTLCLSKAWGCRAFQDKAGAFFKMHSITLTYICSSSANEALRSLFSSGPKGVSSNYSVTLSKYGLHQKAKTAFVYCQMGFRCMVEDQILYRIHTIDKTIFCLFDYRIGNHAHNFVARLYIIHNFIADKKEGWEICREQLLFLVEILFGESLYLDSRPVLAKYLLLLHLDR